MVSQEPQPDLLPPPRSAGAHPTVPGERLGVPLGATAQVADYGRPRPSYAFLALISIVTLAADVATKSWAERHLDGYPGAVEVWRNHLTLVLARNRGGAWGLLQQTSENVRRPFFLLVSVAAIAFIMTLYRRLLPRQRALRWGLPLVLGGALGNVLDRIRYGQVIDFIDVQWVWPRWLKGVGGTVFHWPTFNVADIAICVGVGLMAVDMFTSKRGQPVWRAPRVPPAQSGEPAADWNGAEADGSLLGSGGSGGSADLARAHEAADERSDARADDPSPERSRDNLAPAHEPPPSVR